MSSTGDPQQWSGVGKGFQASDALVLGDIHVTSPSSLKWSCAACSILVVQSDPSDHPVLSVAPNDATSGSVPLAAATYHGVVVLADRGAQWAIRIGGATTAAPAPSPSPPSHSGGGTKPVSAASSQESVTLSGTVTHTDGTPYPGAYVEARGPNLPDNNIHVTTDANGTYSMMLPAGFYDVVAGDPDPAKVDIGFDVKGGANNEIKVPPSTTMDFVSSD